MALATRCPYCHTTFRVAHDQLKLRAGIVRCGACKQVFNGVEHLLRPDAVAPAPKAAPPATAPAPVPEPPPSAAAVPSPAAAPEPAAPSLPQPAPAAPAAPPPAAPEAPALEFAPFSSLAPITLMAIHPDEPAEQEAPPDASEQEAPGSHADQPAALHGLDQPTAPLAPAHIEPGPNEAEQAAPETTQASAYAEQVDFDMAGIPAAQPETPQAETEAAPVSNPDEDTDWEAAAASSPVFRPDAMLLRPEDERPESLFDDDDTELSSLSNAEEPSFVKRGRRMQRWGRVLRVMMALASLLLFFTLLVHAAYLYRIELGTRFPELKPALAQLCELAACTTELAHNIDAISLEAPELQTLPSNKNVYAFGMLLRNRSAKAQAWPSIELTLNDANEQPVLRRVFEPREYLPPGQDVAKGFEPDSEQSVKLHFTLSQVKASGYRVFLFYP